MAKGKKTVIKEIKKLSDTELLINGKEYILLEDVENIESAISMKISSNGNRILRFEDENKKARIDVKRNINIVKYTINDVQRAKDFNRSHDKSLLKDSDYKEIVANAISYTSSKAIIASFSDKKSDKYDSEVGKSVVYLAQEL